MSVGGGAPVVGGIVDVYEDDAGTSSQFKSCHPPTNNGPGAAEDTS